MVEQNQEVTVRQLPDGRVQPARWLGLQGRILRLELIEPSESPHFRIADVAEIQDSDNLYLGEVLGSKAASLLIGIEHILERTALAEIERVWLRDSGGVSR